MNPSLMLFEGGTRGFVVALDRTIDLSVVESNRWAGEMASAMFSHEGETIVVEDIAFDCRLE